MELLIFLLFIGLPFFIFILGKPGTSKQKAGFSDFEIPSQSRLEKLYKCYFNGYTKQVIEEIIINYPGHLLTKKILEDAISNPKLSVKSKFIAARHLQNVDVIYKLLDQTSGTLLKQCLSAIEHLDKKNFLSKLLKYLESGYSTELRVSVIWIIARSNDTKYCDTLLEYLKERNIQVLSSTINALQNCGNEKAILALKGLTVKNRKLGKLIDKTVQLLLEKYKCNISGRISETGSDKNGKLSIDNLDSDPGKLSNLNE